MVRKITKWHVLFPFLEEYGRHVILADIERELETPHQTVRKYASILVNSGILNEEEKPKNVMYSLARENPMVLHYLSTAEKIRLEEVFGKSIHLKRLYEMLASFMSDTLFLVFGSSAGGKIGKDIDVLALGKGARGAGTVYEQTYGKNIHLVASKTDPKGTILREIRKRHLIFNGFDHFVRLFWEDTWKK